MEFGFLLVDADAGGILGWSRGVHEDEETEYGIME
jgi:hypothetical protein